MHTDRAVKHEESDKYCYCNFDSLLEIITKYEKLSKFQHMCLEQNKEHGKMKIG
jgi:hypothetical protein